MANSTLNERKLNSIKRTVEFFFGVVDLKSKSRKDPIPDAKKAFVFISYNITTIPQQTILKFLKKSHASFITDYNGCLDLISTDKDYADKVRQATEMCKINLMEHKENLAEYHFAMYEYYLKQIKIN